MTSRPRAIPLVALLLAVLAVLALTRPISGAAQDDQAPSAASTSSSATPGADLSSPDVPSHYVVAPPLHHNHLKAAVLPHRGSTRTLAGAARPSHFLQPPSAVAVLARWSRATDGHVDLAQTTYPMRT